MINVGDLIAIFKIQDEASGVANNIANTVLPRLDKASELSAYKLTLLGRGFREAGALATALFTVPILGAAKAVIEFGGQFEATTTKLVSLAGVSQDELEGVRQHILALAPTVGIGPNALAEAMVKVSSTTSDTKVALEILDIAAKGSAVGMGEAVSVAGALTAIINSYGKENITAARAGDILTKAVRDGGAEAKELAPTLANVVPWAAKLGVSFEEVAANIATVTKLGVPTSEAVTELASVFAALTRETKRGTEALQSVGSSYADLRAEIREKGLAATLQDLKEKFEGNDKGLFAVVGRLEALKNIMATTGQQSALYRSEVERMTDSVGELDSAFKQVGPTQAQQWAQLKAGIEAVWIELSTSLFPIFKDFIAFTRDEIIPKFKELVDWFNSLPKPVREAAVLMAGFFGIFLPATLLTLGQFAMAIGNISRAVTGLNFALSGGALSRFISAVAAASPLLLGIASVIGLVGAIWWKVSEGEEEAAKKTEELRKQAELASPQFGLIATRVSDIDISLQGLKTTASSMSFNDLKNGVQATLPPMQAVISHIATLKTKTDEQTKADKTLLEQVNALTSAQKEKIDSLEKIGYNTSQVSKETKIAADVIGLYEKQIRNAAEAEKTRIKQEDQDLDISRNNWKDTIAAQERAQKVAEEIMDKFFKDLENSQDIEIQVQEDSWNDTLAAQKEAYARGLKATQEYLDDLDKIKKQDARNSKAFANDLVTAISGSHVADGLGSAVGKYIGSTIATHTTSAFLDAFAPGIGTLLGPLLSKGFSAVGNFIYAGLFQNKSSDLIKQFLESMGGVDKLRKDLTTALGGVTAGALLDQLFTSGRRNEPSVTQEKIDAITGSLEKAKKAAEDAQAAIDKQLGDENETRQKLQAAIEKYKFTIDELGPVWQKQAFHDKIQGLLEDYTLLVGSGIDVKTVIEHMGGAIQEFYLLAVKTGTEVPEQMRPLIQKMIDMGELVDDNGEKVTDMSKINFSMTMTEGFQGIIDKIQELIDKITGDLSDSLNNIPKPPPVHIPVVIDWPEQPPTGVGQPPAEGQGPNNPNPWGVDPGNPDLTKAASGYSGWINGPTPFLVGEGGEPEFVSITPRSKMGEAPNEHNEGFNHTLAELKAMNKKLDQIPFAMRDAVRLRT